MTEEHLYCDAETPDDTLANPAGEPGNEPDEVVSSAEIASYPIEKYKKQHKVWKTIGLCLIGFYVFACIGIILTVRFLWRKIDGQETVIDTIEKPVLVALSTVDSSVEWVPDDPVYSQNSGDGAIIVKVPAGDFLMGNPGISIYLDEYWIYETEVTVAQYRDFLNAGEWPVDEYWKDWLEDRPNLHIYYESGAWRVEEGYEDYPIENANWADARAYCQWAGGDLPTEAQWEKAAQGEDNRNYPWGADNWYYRDSGSFAFANICDINCPEEYDNEYWVNDGYAETAPVGSYPEGVSPYGALDMFGNVHEWTLDWWAEEDFDTLDTVNPQGPADGQARVTRDGDCLDQLHYTQEDGNGETIITQLDLRSRGWGDPEMVYLMSGFRCVIEP